MLEKFPLRSPAFLFTIVLSVLFIEILLFWPLRIDDAYIALRFARHLSGGQGFVWNLGAPPVEGMTSLLWVVLLAPFSALRVDPYAWAKTLGLLATFLGLGMAMLTARSLAGRQTARLMAILVAASPVLIFHAVNGLETGMAVFWVSAMVYLAEKSFHEEATSGSGSRRWPVLYGLAWLFGSLSRPELVLYGAFLTLSALPLLPPGRRKGWLAPGLSVFGLPGVVFFLWRWRYFHFLLPLTYYAKKPEHLVSGMGMGYVLLSLLGLTGGAIALIGFHYSRLARASRERRRLSFLAGPPILLSLSYLFTIPTMGFVYRFVVPFLLPLLLATALARGSRDKPVAGRGVASTILLILTLGQLLSGGLPAFHFARVNTPGFRRCHEKIGEVLAGSPGRGRLLALSDVGAVSFISGWHSAEGVGLVTPAVRVEKRRGLDLITTERPDVIMITGVTPGFAHIPGYSPVRAVPWLVFRGGERSLYQCVYVRDGYPGGDEIARGIKAIHAPVLDTPLYFWLYEWLRHRFGQAGMRVASAPGN